MKHLTSCFLFFKLYSFSNIWQAALICCDLPMLKIFLTLQKYNFLKIHEEISVLLETGSEICSNDRSQLGQMKCSILSTTLQWPKPSRKYTKPCMPYAEPSSTLLLFPPRIAHKPSSTCEHIQNHVCHMQKCLNEFPPRIEDKWNSMTLISVHINFK